MYLRKSTVLILVFALAQITSSCIAKPLLKTITPVYNKTGANVTATQPMPIGITNPTINILFGSDTTVVPATAAFNFDTSSNEWVYTGCSSTPTLTAANSCPGIQIYLNEADAINTNIEVTFAPSTLAVKLGDSSNLISFSPVTYSDIAHSTANVDILVDSVKAATANFSQVSADNGKTWTWHYDGCTPVKNAKVDICSSINVTIDNGIATFDTTTSQSTLNAVLNNESDLNITLNSASYPTFTHSTATVDVLIDNVNAATANFRQILNSDGSTWSWKYEGCNPAKGAAVNICPSIKVAVDASTSTATFTVSATKPWKQPVNKKQPLYKLINNSTATLKLQENKSTSSSDDSSVAIVDNNNKAFATLNFSFNQESGWAFTQCQQGSTAGACSMVNTSISPFADIKMQQTITLTVSSMYLQTFQPNYANESSVCVSTQSGELLGIVAPGESIAWPVDLGGDVLVSTANCPTCQSHCSIPSTTYNPQQQRYTVTSNPGSFEADLGECIDNGDTCQEFDVAGSTNTKFTNTGYQLPYMAARVGASSETPRMSLKEAYNRQQQRAQQPMQPAMQQAPTTARQADVRNKIASFRERYANVKRNVR